MRPEPLEQEVERREPDRAPTLRGARPFGGASQLEQEGTAVGRLRDRSQRRVGERGGRGRLRGGGRSGSRPAGLWGDGAGAQHEAEENEQWRALTSRQHACRIGANPAGLYARPRSGSPRRRPREAAGPRPWGQCPHPAETPVFFRPRFG